VSIPLQLDDLFALLSGNVPVVPFHSAEMGYSEKDHQWRLSLYRRWRRLVESIWMKHGEVAVDRIEVFDRSGHLAYMATFEKYREVEGVLMPRQTVLSDQEGHLLSLEVERFWRNVAIPAEAFALPDACRTGRGS
jgi:hypothetical protein